MCKGFPYIECFAAPTIASQAPWLPYSEASLISVRTGAGRVGELRLHFA